MSLCSRICRSASLLLAGALVLIMARSGPLPGGPRLDAANVPIFADAPARVLALQHLTARVLAELPPAPDGVSGQPLPQRTTNTQLLMLRLAWFEGVQMQRRRQGSGPARSLYQIEPIRALSCCRMAARRGWMDELASACGQAEPDMASACAGLIPTGWPTENLVEACLLTNDRFATTLARVCLEPLPDPMPSTPDQQAELWAAVWKRAFTSTEQRERQKAMFVRAAAGLEEFLPR